MGEDRKNPVEALDGVDDPKIMCVLLQRPQYLPQCATPLSDLDRKEVIPNG